jgi:hypothetical protein
MDGWIDRKQQQCKDNTKADSSQFIVAVVFLFPVINNNIHGFKGTRRRRRRIPFSQGC